MKPSTKPRSKAKTQEERVAALKAETAHLEAQERIARNQLYAHLRRVYPYTRIWVSPSAIETFWLCRRKWAFRYIDKVPQKDTESKLLGTLVHKERENWLIHGTPPSESRAGKLARAGLEHLPPPGYALVEQTAAVPTIYQWGFLGKIDFMLENDGLNRPVWGYPGIPIVGDHKTTSDEQYIKDETTLATADPQATIYAMAAILRRPDTTHNVDLHWSYVVKATSPRSKQVRVRVHREQVARNLPVLQETACSMLTLRQTHGIKANDVTANPAACDAFGGCEYRDRCNLPPAERLRAAFTQVSSPWIPAHHPGGHP